MYIIFPVFLVFTIFCFFFFHWKSRKICQKLCNQSLCQKVCRLNELLAPFGFEYDLSQNIFTSRMDAWQREYGYQYLYDLSSPHFNMILDCEPVYFHYDGCTWLLEFWKGQYGINVGAEIGIYKSDYILRENEFGTAHFHTVSNSELPIFSIKLYNDTVRYYSLQKMHWWLTGFVMGEYAEPENLSMKIQIDFPDYDMFTAFLDGLKARGYNWTNCKVRGTSVTIYYDKPFSRQPRSFQRFTSSFAQWKNRIFLRLYHYVTKPFSNTVDKLLYLYEFLPAAFRHTVSLVYRGKSGLFVRRCTKPCKKEGSCS